MPAPILHVLYAGRGDCMILECDNPDVPATRIFILVDGGPRNYHSGGRAGEAPYHRYLWSACQDLLPQDGFAGVIISHPHEDHYGGYMENLFANGTPPMLTLFVPNNETSREDDTWPISSRMNGPDRTQGFLPPGDADAPYLISPVKPIFPAIPRIKYYYNTTGTRPGNGQGQLNDNLDINDRSILMYTKTPGVADEMGIFFTGDNNADTIAEQMGVEFNTAEKRRFAIYKIQHHGSIFENQMNFYAPMFYHDVGAVAFAYALLNAVSNSEFFTNPKDGPSVKYAAREFHSILKNGLNEAPDDHSKTRAYYEQLNAIIKSVQQSQLETLGSKPDPGEEETFIELPQPDPAHPLITGQPLDPDPAALLNQLDIALNHADIPNRALWAKYRSNTTADLMTYLQVRNVKNFYLTFKADVYVISANFRYSHPRCETLFGLALAVQQQNRAARLYVTNAKSVYYEGLQKLSWLMNADSIGTLFHGDFLKVSYLSYGTYISLDGTSQGINSTVFNIERDLHHMTQTINFGLDDAEWRDTLHELLERHPQAALLKTVRCQVQFLGDLSDPTSLRCLYPTYATGGMSLNWTLTAVNQPTQSFWVDLDIVNLATVGPNTIRCRVERYGAIFEEIVCEWAGTNAANSPLWNIKDMNVTETFYYDPTAGVKSGPNPNQYPLVKFLFQQLPNEPVMAAAGEAVTALVTQHFQAEDTADDEIEAMTEAPGTGQEEPLTASPALALFDAVTPSSPPAPATSIPVSSLVAPVTSTPVSSPESSLGQAFKDLGDAIAETENPDIIQTLSLLFGDSSLLSATLGKLPQVILQAGFTNLTVDLDRSTAIMVTRPIVGEVIDSAVLICQLNPDDKDIKWPVSISMAGFEFTLSSITVNVEKCQTSQVTISVASGASLLKADKTSLELDMTWSSSKTESEISFTASVTSVEDLVTAFTQSTTASDDILQAEIPLMAKASGANTAPSLGSTTAPMNEIGFSLLQPVDRVAQYELADIWVKTEFPDWTNFLPLPDKFKDIQGVAVVRVENPLQAGSRRLAVAIRIILPVPNKTGSNITADFCATPLTRVGDYDYRFRILGTSAGVTMSDISAAIGMEDVSSQITDAVPGLQEMVDTIMIQEVGISIDQTGNTWAFQEWSVDLYVPFFAIISGFLILSDAQIKMSKSQDGHLAAMGEAVFRNPSLEKEAHVSFGLPTAEKPGYITLAAPDGLSLADVFATFGLGDLSDVPIIGTIATTEITYCSAKFQRPTSSSGGVEIASFDVNFREPSLSLGPIKVQYLEFSMSWRRGQSAQTGGQSSQAGGQSSPAGGQSSQVGGQQSESTICFQLSAQLENVAAVVRITYDGDKKTLTGSITSSAQAPLKVLDALQILAPGVDSALHSSLGGLSIKAVTMSLDVETIHPTSFHIDFTDDAELNLSSATDNETLDLTSLQLDYTTTTPQPVAGKGTGWELSMKATGKVGSGTGQLGSILEWLLGSSIEEDLPDFITEATVDLENTWLEVSCTKQKGKDESVSVLAASFDIGSLTIQLAKMRTEPSSDAGQSDTESVASAQDEESTGSPKPETLPSPNAETPASPEAETSGANAEETPASTTSGTTPKSKSSEPQVKSIVRIVVSSLPRPPPLPLVGQMDQPFTVDFRWLGEDLSSDDINILNSSVTFQGNPIPLEADGSNANQGVACGKGVSFMLLEDGKPIISSKPQVSTSSTPEKPTNTAADSTTDNPDAQKSDSEQASSEPEASGTEQAGQSSSERTSSGQPAQDSTSEEPTEMKPYEKNINGLSISNIGVNYSSADQSLAVKFNATAILGPLSGELINFGLTIKIPSPSQGQTLSLTDWNNLEIGVDLDGLSLGMTGDSLSVAGFLQRVDTTSVQGFQGGLEVTFEPYAFTGFASYEDVEKEGENFISLMLYAMLEGPILKTPLIEIRGISGGFGLGSQLTVPPVTDLQSFPFLMSGATPNAIDMFSTLEGSSSSPSYITQVNGATWFAVGVLGTACETVDISAVLTLALGPQVDEIAIVGTATASFPKDQPPDDIMAFIELDFSAKADMTHGYMYVQGSIAPTSFLLNSDCRPTGAFVVASWFDPSSHAGEWGISIGGWHPAYVPPSYYPKAPAQLGVAWRYSSDLNITGEAYAALTPDALMAGSALNALFSVGPVGANFDFRADFILYMHPLHYEADVYVSASVWYEIDAFFVHKKLSVSLGADLSLSGPPFAGCVSFDVAVITIRVRFGDQRTAQTAALSLSDFIAVCMKKGNTDNQTEPESDHVLSLNAGGIPGTVAATAAQTPSTTWNVRASTLVFSVVSRIPASTIELTGGTGSSSQINGPILSRPMQLADSPGLTAPLTVTITSNKTKAPVSACRFDPIQENVPASLWGAYDSDNSAMLDGASRKATLPHVTGLRISPPASEWSINNPKVMSLSELDPPVPISVNFQTDTTRDANLDARARIDGGGEEDFACARQAFTGQGGDGSSDDGSSDNDSNAGDSSTDDQEAKAIQSRNDLRKLVLNQWALCRGQANTADSTSAGQGSAPSLADQVQYLVPQTYVEGLDGFCRVAPRVTVA